MRAMFKRELSALMHGLTGWIIFAAVPAAFAVMTGLHLFAGSAADFVRVIVDSTVVFVLIVPLLAAQGFAKDKRMGADKLLHSLPLKSGQIAWGRFFAWCVPFLAGVAVSGLYPAALSIFAQIAAVQTVCGMLLFALCGIMMIALAMCISRVSRNALINIIAAIAVFAVCYYAPQISAFIASIGASYWAGLIVLAAVGVFFGWKSTRSATSALIFGLAVELVGFLLLSGSDTAVAAFWDGAVSLVNYQSHFQSLYIGVLNVSDLLHFVLVTAFFVLLSAQGWRMEKTAKRRAD